MLFSEKEREILFLLVFQNEFNGGEVLEDESDDFAANHIYNILEEIDKTRVNLEDAKQIEKHYKRLVENKEQIDLKIKNNLKNWNINRLGKVELALLRLYIYEVMNSEPKKQVINDILNLSNKYGTDKSHKFVNGFIRGLIENE